MLRYTDRHGYTVDVWARGDDVHVAVADPSGGGWGGESAGLCLPPEVAADVAGAILAAADIHPASGLRIMRPPRRGMDDARRDSGMHCGDCRHMVRTGVPYTVHLCTRGTPSVTRGSSPACVAYERRRGGE